MLKKYILALDQGTTGSRAFLFDKEANVVSSAYKEFRQYFPYPGWVEHDADEIWESVENVIRNVLKKSNIQVENIEAIGITNQRETSIIWDSQTSKPLHNAIVWQCRRTEKYCQTIKKYENVFKKKTGLIVDSYFSGTKLRWLLDNVEGIQSKVKSGRVRFGTVDSWLIWKLTGGKDHVTDVTNASRTLMFNIETLQWDDDLLKILRIPKNILPKVQRSGALFGTTEEIAGLSKGTPIMAVLGDQQAALYGQGCYKEGSIKNTYGTGCFMVLNTGKKRISSKTGLLTTIASDEQGNPIYALEGSVFIAGAVMQWLRDGLKFFKRAEDSEKMIKGLSDTQGVYFVPAFVGLGCPYWDSQAKGVITGLTRGVTDKHIIRAGLESMAYQTKDVFDIMKKEFGRTIGQLNVDGGGSQNNFLMQFQSDILGINICRPHIVDSTVLGVAYLAGVQCGFYVNLKSIRKSKKADTIFSTQMSDKTRDYLYDGWCEAVKKARG